MRKKIFCFYCNRKLIVTIYLKMRNLEMANKTFTAIFKMSHFRQWWSQISINQPFVVTSWKFNIWQQTYKQISEKSSTTSTQKKTLAELVKMWTKYNSKRLTYFHFNIFKMSVTETYFPWLPKAMRYCHTGLSFDVIAKPIKDVVAGLWNISVDNSPLMENKTNMEFLKFAYNSFS